MAFRHSTPDLVVFGEFFFDLVFYKLAESPRMGLEVRTDHFVEAPGGGLATTAMVAAALGTTTSVVTRVGADAPLHHPWQRLGELGIKTDACEFRKNFSTALTVCAAYGTDRMMITHDPVNQRLGDLLLQPKVQRLLRAARHVHFAFSFGAPRRWLPVLDDLHGRGVGLSADIGWNPEVLESKTLPRMLRRLDFFFPNEAEAQVITGASSPFQALQQLGRWVHYPVLKLGPKGSIALIEGNILREHSIPVRAVDATGAGDAFNGGFLHAYLRKWPWQDCLGAGNICGAIATTAPGGTGILPKHGRLRKLLATVRKARKEYK